jgi:lysophospholipase L1-like esterase
MPATTHALTDGQALSVITSQQVSIRFNAGVGPITIEGSLGSSQFDKIHDRITSDRPAEDSSGRLYFNAGRIITMDVRSFEEIRFVGAAVNIDVSPFDSARPLSRIATIIGLGNSQLASGVTTSAGNDQQNLATGRHGTVNQHNVIFWASGYSRARLAYAGVAGEAGLTSAQVLANHLATARARRATFCVIDAGTNDIGAAIATSVTIANTRRMIEGLLEVGTTPIISGVLPNRVTTGAAYDNLNEAYRRLAVEYRIPFEDTWGPCVGVDGLGTAGLFRDNTHLTHDANRARGQRIADLILAEFPRIPASLLPFSNAAGKAGLFPNPIFNLNSGAVTPTSWTTSGTGASSAVNSGTVGNTFAHTRGSANALAHTTSAIAAAGSTYLWVGGIQSSGGVPNASSYFGFRDPASVAASHAWQMRIDSVEIPANLEFAVLFRVPTGFPANRFQHQNAGSSSSLIELRRNELYLMDPWI